VTDDTRPELDRLMTLLEVNRSLTSELGPQEISARYWPTRFGSFPPPMRESSFFTTESAEAWSRTTRSVSDLRSTRSW
jgi:hypothetical protein